MMYSGRFLLYAENRALMSAVGVAGVASPLWYTLQHEANVPPLPQGQGTASTVFPPAPNPAGRWPLVSEFWRGGRLGWRRQMSFIAHLSPHESSTRCGCGTKGAAKEMGGIHKEICLHRARSHQFCSAVDSSRSEDGGKGKYQCSGGANGELRVRREHLSRKSLVSNHRALTQALGRGSPSWAERAGGSASLARRTQHFFEKCRLRRLRVGATSRPDAPLAPNH